MAQSHCAIRLGLLPLFLLAFHLAPRALATPTVWTGPDLTFTKTGINPGNPSDPANQDRMTSNVWLTRGSSQGMFNIAKEPSYDGSLHTSPADTEWATDLVPGNEIETIAATNWQHLSFAHWAESYGGPGSFLSSNITTHNAVVHLITDDIYLDLQFTQFSSGGSFTYVRSTGTAAPSPTGDYNHNGVVDAGDYVLWRDTLNQSASPSGSGADGNANGTIDSGDYTYWKARFGNVAGSGADAAAIPEPSSLPVGLQLVFVLICVARLRIRSS